MLFKPLLFGAVFLFFLFLCHVERSRNIQAKQHVWRQINLTLAAENLITKTPRRGELEKYVSTRFLGFARNGRVVSESTHLTLAAECLVTRNTRSRGIRKMPYRSVNKAFGGKRKTKKLNEKAPETGMQKMNIFRAEKNFSSGFNRSFARQNCVKTIGEKLRFL